MQFVPVKTQAERDRIVDEYRNIKDKLKNQFLQEKLGEQNLFTDSSKLFKPLMETTKATTKELKGEIAKGQNQLVPYIKELEKYNENLEAFKELPEPSEPEKRKKRKSNILDPDKPLDINDRENLKTLELEYKNHPKLEFKSEVKLPLPNEILSEHMNIDEILENCIKINQSLAGQKKRKNEVETIKKYSDILRTIKQRIPFVVEGNGLKKYNPYKIRQNNTFGNLYIDPNELVKGHLKAYKNNKLVLSQKIDASLFDLLTKRYNSNKDYSNKAIETFNKLLELSSLPKLGSGVHSKKANLNVIYYSNPNDLLKKLELLSSAKKAGNTGVDNDINSILDELLRCGAVSKSVYKQLYKNIFA